jgi:hypothetical protein
MAIDLYKDFCSGGHIQYLRDLFNRVRYKEPTLDNWEKVYNQASKYVTFQKKKLTTVEAKYKSLHNDWLSAAMDIRDFAMQQVLELESGIES